MCLFENLTYGNCKKLDKRSTTTNTPTGTFRNYYGLRTGLVSWFYSYYLLVSLAIITATLIQIFSNFANDYGDSQRGTDNQFRLGPTRTMQSGEISKKEMVKGMSVVGGLSLIFGIGLVYFGTWHHSKIIFFIFIAFGILSLLAAYFYTAGQKILRIHWSWRFICFPVFWITSRCRCFLSERQLFTRITFFCQPLQLDYLVPEY